MIDQSHQISHRTLGKVFADEFSGLFQIIAIGHFRKCHFIEAALAGLGPAVHPIAHDQSTVRSKIDIRHAHAPDIIFRATHAVAGPLGLYAKGADA